LSTTLDAASHAVPDLKPNPVGGITKASDWPCYTVDIQPSAIPSGRSGGVIDAILMDLRVGLSVPFQRTTQPLAGDVSRVLTSYCGLPIQHRNVLSPT
jgi:hypothetical protein